MATPPGKDKLLYKPSIFRFMMSHRIRGTGIFTFIWLMCMVNVSIQLQVTIHGILWALNFGGFTHPWKINNMEATNHRFVKENEIEPNLQGIMFRVNLQGCTCFF